MLGCNSNSPRYHRKHMDVIGGRTCGSGSKGLCSLRERSRQEPLLKTLLKTLSYCKTYSRPPSQNPFENPSPECDRGIATPVSRQGGYFGRVTKTACSPKQPRTRTPSRAGTPCPLPLPKISSRLQNGPAERGHVKKRQKSSKSVKKFFDTFRQFSRRAKNVKNRQKVSKVFSTLSDN